MGILVYLLGLGHIAICSLLILYPRETIDVVKNMFEKYSLKQLAGIPAAYGVLFIIAASSTIHPGIFWLFGLLGIGEAVLAFVNPNKTYTRLVDWYFGSLSERVQGGLGIIGIIFGTLVLTWVK